MKILFTGLLGLTGSEIAKYLLLDKKNYIIGSIVRNENFSSRSLTSRYLPKEIYLGSLDDEKFLKSTINKFKPDLIVHLAQIKFSANIIRSLKSSKQNPHLIILGTTGVFSKFKNCSSIYKDSENFIKNNYQNFTVIRSSLIYGSSSDKNFHKLISRVIERKIIFLPNIAKYSLYQPIYYKDIAKCIYDLIENNSRPKGFFTYPGPNIVSIVDVIKEIEEISNIKSKVIYLPLNIFIIFISFFEKFSLLKKFLPIRSEQLLRLKENKVYPSDKNLLKNNLELTIFKKGVSNQFKEMQSYKLK